VFCYCSFLLFLLVVVATVVVVIFFQSAHLVSKARYLISINGPIANNTTRLQGQLKDARPFDFELPSSSLDVLVEDPGNESLVGKEIDGKFCYFYRRCFFSFCLFF
jgi:hypothetical protein